MSYVLKTDGITGVFEHRDSLCDFIEKWGELNGGKRLEVKIQDTLRGNRLALKIKGDSVKFTYSDNSSRREERRSDSLGEHVRGKLIEIELFSTYPDIDSIDMEKFEINTRSIKAVGYLVSGDEINIDKYKAVFKVLSLPSSVINKVTLANGTTLRPDVD